MIQDLKWMCVNGLLADQEASVKGPFVLVSKPPDFM